MQFDVVDIIHIIDITHNVVIYIITLIIIHIILYTKFYSSSEDGYSGIKNAYLLYLFI